MVGQLVTVIESDYESIDAKDTTPRIVFGTVTTSCLSSSNRYMLKKPKTKTKHYRIVPASLSPTLKKHGCSISTMNLLKEIFPNT